MVTSYLLGSSQTSLLSRRTASPFLFLFLLFYEHLLELPLSSICRPRFFLCFQRHFFCVLELSEFLQDAYLGQCALKPGHNQLGDAPTAARHTFKHECRQAESKGPVSRPLQAASAAVSLGEALASSASSIGRKQAGLEGSR